MNVNFNPQAQNDFRAAAAAKLVIQSLDPLAKKRRRQYCSGLPQGTLSLHVRYMKNISKAFLLSISPTATNIRICLRITIQGTEYNSKTLEVFLHGQSRASETAGSESPKKAAKRVSKIHIEPIRGICGIIDDFRTFSVEVEPQYDHPKNHIRFELFDVAQPSLAPGGARSGRLLDAGQATIHLHDVIKEMCGNRLVPLQLKEKRLCDIDIEFGFRYGALGYGYSHHLHHLLLSIGGIMGKSLFYHVHPPPERADCDGFLKPEEMPYPDVIGVQQSVSRKEVEDEEDPSSTEEEVEGEYSRPTLVDMSTVSMLIKQRKRLERMTKEYLGLHTLQDQIKYLDALMALPVEDHRGEEAEVRVEDEEDAADRMRAFSTMRAHSEISAGGKDFRLEDETSKQTIEGIVPMLMMAPSLPRRSKRIQYGRHKAEKLDVEWNTVDGAYADFDANVTDKEYHSHPVIIDQDTPTPQPVIENSSRLGIQVEGALGFGFNNLASRISRMFGGAAKPQQDKKFSEASGALAVGGANTTRISILSRVSSFGRSVSTIGRNSFTSMRNWGGK